MDIGPEVVKYTLTGATDWPMFMVMCGAIGAVFTFLWVIIALLLRHSHGLVITNINEKFDAVLERISSQRKDDSDKCDECKNSHDESKDEFRFALFRELDALWEKTNECCKKQGIPETKKYERGEKYESGN